MKYFISNIDELHKKFLIQVRKEYEAFKTNLFKQPTYIIYDESLKITFYREIYRYLSYTNLNHEEYEKFSDGKSLERLWSSYCVSELPKNTHDYFRQLIKLYKNNNDKAKEAQ